jgi:hypothetical protein
MTTAQLSQINPDWPDLSNQLEVALAQTATWPPLLPTQTASLLIEAVTTMGAFLAAGLQNVYEEDYSQTARMSSSLLAGARMQGVRLTRKTPASVPVTFTNPTTTPITIGAYQTFSSPGTQLFNRSALLIPAASGGVAGTLNATLYQGFVTQVIYNGVGQDSQIIVVPVPGFTISDVDVQVTVNNVPLQVITDGIWHYPVSSAGLPNYVVQDMTLPTGELIMEFGNSLFGVVPPNGSSILATYAVTDGLSGNNSGFQGAKIAWSGNTSLTCLATAPLSGGLDQPSAELYRDSPLVFSSYQRAVSIPDHPAIATKYPGVVDAIFLGQKDIAPNLLPWMNVVYCYLLMNTGSQMDSGTFTNGFLPWLQNRAMPLDYVQQLATIIPVNVNATVYIFGTGDPTTVQTAAVTQVTNLLSAGPGVLGRNLYMDDIRNALRTSDPNVDYVVLNTPSSDIICKILPPNPPTVNPATSAGGALSAGTYNYSVSAVGTQGETFASPSTTLILGSGAANSAVISWPVVPGAVSYNVYGRLASNLFLLGNVPAGTNITPSTTYSFTDLGTITSGAGLNQINYSGLSYVTAGSIQVNVQFTTRTGGQTLGVTT